MKLSQLQNELKPWTDHNFGDRPAWMPLMGVLEELGELCHAHLKRAQGIRGYDDPSKFRLEAEDAIADVIVYLADYANSVNIRLSWDDWKGDDFIRDAPDSLLLSITAEIGSIHGSRDMPDHETFGKHVDSRIYSILRLLVSYASVESIEMERVLDDTWAKVKERDWKIDSDVGDVQ